MCVCACMCKCVAFLLMTIDLCWYVLTPQKVKGHYRSLLISCLCYLESIGWWLIHHAEMLIGSFFPDSSWKPFYKYTTDCFFLQYQRGHWRISVITWIPQISLHRFFLITASRIRARLSLDMMHLSNELIRESWILAVTWFRDVTTPDQSQRTEGTQRSDWRLLPVTAPTADAFVWEESLKSKSETGAVRCS